MNQFSQKKILDLEITLSYFRSKHIDNINKTRYEQEKKNYLHKIKGKLQIVLLKFGVVWILHFKVLEFVIYSLKSRIFRF